MINASRSPSNRRGTSSTTAGTAGWPGTSPNAKPPRTFSPLGALSTPTIKLLVERGLEPETADRYGVQTASAPDGGSDWVAIPFTRAGAVLGHAYRRVIKDPNSRNNFAQDKGGVNRWFWNADVISARDDPSLASQPLVITEGVFDALHAIQAGFVRTVSVPNGAPESEVRGDGVARYAFVAEAADELRNVKEIILATDADPAGHALLNDLAVRLGPGRCRWVRYPDGCKDLADVAGEHGAAGIVAAINAASWVHVPGLYRMSDLPPAPEREPLISGVAGMDDHYRLRRCDMTIVTGIPSMGKSTWVNDLACNMVANHGWNVAFASLEQNPQDDHRRNLRRWFNRKPEERQTVVELACADAWIDDHFSFIVADDENDTTLDWVLETLATAVVRFAADLIIIDPWNELDHDRPPHKSLTEYTRDAIRKVKRFARRWGIHVIIVAHPTKIARAEGGELPMPSLYDIADSATWFDKPDVGVVVHRDKLGSKVRVAKSRYHDIIGKPGTVDVALDGFTGRYMLYCTR